MPRRAIHAIEQSECLELLAGEHVGRLVFVDGDGPAALPVVYSMAGKEVVFRSEPGAKIQALHGRPVGFEVDAIDATTHTGWSVLLRGTSREVELDDLPDLLRQFDGDVPLPWKTGVHRVWVAIAPTMVTGRRLSGGLIDEES